ncbi:hypothetical protein D3C72_1396700 [compost metagenome]
MQALQRAVLPGRIDDLLTGSDDDGDIRMAPAAGKFSRKSVALLQRGMRTADGDKLHLFRSFVEKRPAGGHIGKRDGDGVSRVNRGQPGFRRYTLDMQHGCCGGGAKSSAERLQIIPRRLCRAEAAQQRNTIRRCLTGEITDERPEGVVDALRQSHVDNTLRTTVFFEINA